MTDIRVAWTETAAVKNKAQKWVFAALMDITEAFPFPIIGGSTPTFILIGNNTH